MKLKRMTLCALALSLLCACTPNNTQPTPSPTAAPTASPTAAPTAEPTPAPTEVRVALLKGPTGLGGAWMMDPTAIAGKSSFSFEIMAEPTQAVAALTKGEVDIAAVPTNLASTLYHKTDGGVRLLCLNTLGVLHILERGDSVSTLADLEGRTVHAFGQGANPEYVLNYLLEQNGLTPGEDVTVQWHASADEVSTLMAAGEIELCMLPVPAATGVLLQNQDVRSAIDLNDAWADAGIAGTLTMGCLVARTEFAAAHPDAVEDFLRCYQTSVSLMTREDCRDEAAQRAEESGIVPKAAIAKAAIPDANLCFITGDDMMAGIQGYYQVLFAADPASIGGSIPDGAFYYQYNG